jgi:endo-1,3(4)-beta-glucanase
LALTSCIGTGQTFTNELYFIGTRPNPSGSPICGTLPQNPYGSFAIQDASSGNYVAASSANTNLVASATAASGAATFNSSYVPNAGTLQLTSTGQFVTCDQSGTDPLAAARATASTWERFTIRPKVGAASGVYSIKAASNGLYVTVGSDGSLINGGADEAASAGFNFVAA